jgi:hypothetical protein
MRHHFFLARSANTCSLRLMPKEQSGKAKLKRAIKAFAWPTYVEKAVLQGLKEAGKSLPDSDAKGFTVEHSIKPTEKGVAVEFTVSRGRQT